MLSNTVNGLTEQKFESGNIFSLVQSADFNNDKYSDIIAYDFLKRKLNIYYNYGNATFYKVKEVSLTNSINAFKLYRNTIYTSSGNSIEIFRKNKEGTYISIGHISSKLPIDDFLINDFNDDGLQGIVCLNRKSSTLSIFFGKKDGAFSEEFTSLIEKGLQDISFSKSGNIENLVLLSNTGSIVWLNNDFSTFSQEKLGVEVAAVSKFNIKNKGKGICFYDKFNKSLYLLNFNEKGIVSNLYSVKLFQDTENILVDDSKTQKIFYCYNKGEQSLNVITFNQSTKKNETNSIYLPFPISQIWLSGNGVKKVNVILKNVNKFEYGLIRNIKNKFDYTKYKSFKFDLSSVNYFDNKLVIKTNKNSALKIFNTDTKNISELQEVEEKNILFVDGAAFSLNDKILLVSSLGEISSLDLKTKEKVNYKVNNNNFLYFNSLNDLVFETSKSSENNSIFFYNKKNKDFCKLSFSNNEFSVVQLFKEDDLKYFTVMNLNKKNLIVAYAGKKNMSLKIKRIVDEK